MHSANRLHFVVRFRDSFNEAALREGFRDIVDKHDILRAWVVDRDERPWIEFHAPPDRLIQEFDLTGLAEDRRGNAGHDLASNFIWKRFDFEKNFLWRSALIRVSNHVTIFAFVLHHFLGDLHTLAGIRKELLLKYTQGSHGQGEQKKEAAALQYSDYLLSIDEWISSPAGQLALSNSCNSLVEAPPLPKLEEQPLASCAAYEFTINKDLQKAVEQLSSRHHVTTFTVLLAAHHLVLAHLTKCKDVTIAAVVNGRDLPALHRVAGCFVDRRYYRVRLNGAQTFRDLIELSRESIIADMQQPFVRFDHLQQKVIKTRGSAISAPVFNFRPQSAKHRKRGASIPPWEPYLIAPAPDMSMPGFSVDYYWMELKDTDNGFAGHIRPKGCSPTRVLTTFESVLRLAAEDERFFLADILE